MTIFIGNILEEALPLVALMNPQHKEMEIEEDLALNDRFLLSRPYQDKILVTPFPPDEGLIADISQLTSARHLFCLSPTEPTTSICNDIISDEVLQREILELTCGSEKNLQLVSYVASSEFYELVSWFEKKGFNVSLPEAPAFQDAWTVTFFDSKAGFAQMNKELRGGAGIGFIDRYITTNENEVLALALHVFAKCDGAVLKTNRGLSGMGLGMFRKKDGRDELERSIKQLIAEDPFWREEPVIVEEYITADERIGGGQPSFELWIDKKGKVHPLYACGMRLTSTGSFRGMELGRQLLPPKIQSDGFAFAKKVGLYLARKGYRGFFDVDMIAGRDGKLYPLEANIRRTGGTHVFEIANHLLGNNFLDAWYLVSNNMFFSDNLKGLSYSEVKKRSQRVLYPLKDMKRGVILTMASYLPKGYLGYMVIGGDKKDCYELEEAFLSRVSARV